MPKPDRQVVIIGEQQAEVDLAAMVRLLLRFARQQQAKLTPGTTTPPTGQPAHPDRGAVA